MIIKNKEKKVKGKGEKKGIKKKTQTRKRK